MRRVLAPVALLFCLTPAGAAEPAPAPRAVARPATAVVESSLATASGRIRQFAFDGNPETYFASEKNAAKTDHFTLTFDTPAAVKAVRVLTGLPKGGDTLDAGVLEVSADGKAFEELAKFADGSARGTPKGKVKAIRIRPTDDLNHPLVIREIGVDADPAVAAFDYPIEFVVDVSDAPEMKEWAEKAARVCERQYPMLCDELMSDGFVPLTVIRMTLKSSYNGVAAGQRRAHHRFRAVLQGEPERHRRDGSRNRPLRATVPRPEQSGLAGGRRRGLRPLLQVRGDQAQAVDPRERAKYDGSYRVTAAFLAFVTEKYDPQIVRKLNATMRAGKYKDDVWKELDRSRRLRNSAASGRSRSRSKID